MNTIHLRCPVCGSPFTLHERTLRCARNHCFDLAREGYVNLLAGSHKTNTGDSRQMAVSRRAFLERGYFSALREAVREELKAHCPTGAALDICCGEGYYTEALAREGSPVYAFDLSKEMVRLAARRHNSTCLVANIAAIPLADDSISAAIHLFAPFHGGEFARVLHPQGRLITVVPGARHLMGMKEVLYAAPYENDEAPPDAPSFQIADRRVVNTTVTLDRAEDIAALVHMTPYGVRSPREGMERLLAMDRLTTELSFVLYSLEKR